MSESKTRILIVEDEEKLARFLELELTHEGYLVDKVFDGRTGLDRALAESFDLVLLDVMLPGLNGMEVLRRLRAETSLPVILLTARDAVMDKVAGLDSGANDYITKPFAIEELLARIRNLMRQNTPAGPEGEPLDIAGIRMDVQGRAVWFEDRSLSLTRREFDLLRCLMENRDIVLSRDTLLQKVWGYDYAGETNVVDVYIRYLRSKLGEEAGAGRIQTVRGIGYVLRSTDA